MATLYLDPEPEHGAWRDLHAWLGGAWAVLFSNPEDFQPLERHEGAWLAAMRQEFGARTLHALIVRRDTRPLQASPPSWVDDLRQNREAVWLREPPFAAADAVSFAARALRGHHSMGKAAYGKAA
jgi:alkyl hydroperoxide reductase subunit AhpC